MILDSTADQTPEEVYETAQARADSQYAAERDAEARARVQLANTNIVQIGLLFLGATVVLGIAKARL